MLFKFIKRFILVFFIFILCPLYSYCTNIPAVNSVVFSSTISTSISIQRRKQRLFHQCIKYNGGNACYQKFNMRLKK